MGFFFFLVGYFCPNKNQTFFQNVVLLIKIT